MIYVNYTEYIEDCFKLVELIRESKSKFEAIVVLKRSGWILGAILSNQLTLPVFTESEFDSIPIEFQNILIVDDKVSTGKSINKMKKLCYNKHKKFHTASLYIQDTTKTKYYIRETNGIRVKPFYEKH